MPPIDPLSYIGAAIRAQWAAEADARPQAGKPAERSNPRRADDEPQQAGGADAALLERIRKLSLKSGDSRRAVFRLFLESTLSRELGPFTRDDPELSELVERVMSRLEEDQDMGAALLAAGDVLLRRAQRAG